MKLTEKKHRFTLALFTDIARVLGFYCLLGNRVLYGQFWNNFGHYLFFFVNFLKIGVKKIGMEVEDSTYIGRARET